MDIGDGAGPSGVAVADGLGEAPGPVRGDEVDGAAGPAGARELAAEEPGGGLGRLDQRVERRGAVLEVVAAGGVRRRHQPAEGRDVAAAERLGPLPDPLVLGQDVPRPPAADRVEVVPGAVRGRRARHRGASGRPRRPRRVWKKATTRSHSARRRLYIPSASRREVFESQTTIAGAGSPSGEPLVIEAPAVEAQGVPGAAEEDRELVEQPRPDPDEVVLAPLEHLGQRHPGRVVEVGRGPPPRPARPGAGTRPATPGGSPSWTAPRRGGRRRRSPPRTRTPAAHAPLARPRRPRGHSASHEPGSPRSGPSRSSRVDLVEVQRPDPRLAPETARPATTVRRSIAAARTSPPL